MRASIDERHTQDSSDVHEKIVVVLCPETKMNDYFFGAKFEIRNAGEVRLQPSKKTDKYHEFSCYIFVIYFRDLKRD